MANFFPALKPTARSFQLGQYPVKTYRAMSGAVVRRSFGNKPFGYTLELEFANVSEATVNTIIDHYNNRQGGTLGFLLPYEPLSGYSGNLQGRIADFPNLEWLYAEPPSVSSVIKDISTVIVKLVGEMQ